jgi:hypothetical protein
MPVATLVAGLRGPAGPGSASGLGLLGLLRPRDLGMGLAGNRLERSGRPGRVIAEFVMQLAVSSGNYVTDISRSSFREFHSLHATSCRTHRSR